MAEENHTGQKGPSPSDGHDSSAGAGAHPSTGDRLFNRSVYGVFNFTGVLAVSVALSAVVMFSRTGFRRGFDHMVEKLTTTLKWQPKSARDFAVSTATWIGGTIVAVPVGWAKRHKPQVVNWLNRAFGSEDEKRQAKQDSAEGKIPTEAYPISWREELVNRLAAIGVVVGSVMLISKKSDIIERITRASTNWGSKLTGGGAAPAAGLVGEHVHRMNKGAKAGYLLGFDAIATAVSTAIFFVTDKIQESLRESHRAKKREAGAVSIEASAHAAPVSAPSAPLEEAATTRFRDAAPSPAASLAQAALRRKSEAAANVPSL